MQGKKHLVLKSSQRWASLAFGASLELECWSLDVPTYFDTPSPPTTAPPARIYDLRFTMKTGIIQSLKALTEIMQRCGASIFGFGRSFDEGACPHRPVTESKRCSKPKRPLPVGPQRALQDRGKCFNHL
jgi:hypothetical protein